MTSQARSIKIKSIIQEKKNTYLCLCLCCCLSIDFFTRYAAVGIHCSPKCVKSSKICVLQFNTLQRSTWSETPHTGGIGQGCRTNEAVPLCACWGQSGSQIRVSFADAEVSSHTRAVPEWVERCYLCEDYVINFTQQSL